MVKSLSETMNPVKRSCDYPMLSLEDAWRRIAASLAPLPPVRKPLAHVSGLVLAEGFLGNFNINCGMRNAD
jgi:molybdopterin biosynthesis enzyme